MAEDIKKDKKKDNRGGRREGAGRKKGVKIGQIKENPKNTMLTFRVSEVCSRRIKQLRVMTKYDTMPFVDMLEKWVEDMAKDYGID